jgi:predicted DNA-binding helix-hairpin-helix protein
MTYSLHRGPIPQVEVEMLPPERARRWAQLHPDYFPVDINKASKCELLRVPCLGEITVDCILEE